jgi:hypothetical protein
MLNTLSLQAAAVAHTPTMVAAVVAVLAVTARPFLVSRRVVVHLPKPH